MNTTMIRSLGTLAVAALALTPVVTGPHLTAHAASPHIAIHRNVHLAGRMFYQDGSPVPRATVYVLPYGATDTDQAYESFTALNGFYLTPYRFSVRFRYTIYIVCTDAEGNEYSYTNDFGLHASYSSNEYIGTAYMQPDNSTTTNGADGGGYNSGNGNGDNNGNSGGGATGNN